MKKTASFFSLPVCLAVSTISVHAAIKYWDINGTATGAGGSAPEGTWENVSANWNDDPTGEAGGTITAWSGSTVTADTAVFSAGSDATGSFTVTVGDGLTGYQAGFSQITFEEGTVEVKGLTVGAAIYATLYPPPAAGVEGTIHVNSGAEGILNIGIPNVGGNIVKTGPGRLTVANTIEAYFGFGNAAGSYLKINEGVYSVPEVTVTIVNGSSVTKMGRAREIYLGSDTTSGTWEYTGATAFFGTHGTFGTSIILGAGGGEIRVTTGGETLQIGNSCSISGSGNLTVSGSGILRLHGSGATTLSSYTGNTIVNAGATLKNGIVNSIPNGPGKGNITLNGSLDVWGTSARANVNGLSGSGTVYASGYNASIPAQIYVGYNDQSSTFSGDFATLNGVNWLAVTKVGAGTLTLNGQSTTVGSVTNSLGKLALTGSGAFPYIYRVSLGGGTTFDVSGASPSPYHIGSTNELEATTGSGSTATVVGSLTLDAGANLALSYASGTPAINIASGTLTLNANVTAINVMGGALASGNSYVLISKSGSGAVAGTVGSFSVGGDGIAGGGTPSLSVVGGQLVLSIGTGSPSPVPATNLTIVAVGSTSRSLGGQGAASSAYNVYAATNVTLPMTNWWLLGTTNSSVGGVIQFLDSQATNKQRFYRFGQTVTP